MLRPNRTSVLPREAQVTPDSHQSPMSLLGLSPKSMSNIVDAHCSPCPSWQQEGCPCFLEFVGQGQVLTSLGSMAEGQRAASSVLSQPLPHNHSPGWKEGHYPSLLYPPSPSQRKALGRGGVGSDSNHPPPSQFCLNIGQNPDQKPRLGRGLRRMCLWGCRVV